MEKFKAMIRPYINQIVIMALLLCGVGCVWYIKHMDVQTVKTQQQLPDDNWPK